MRLEELKLLESTVTTVKGIFGKQDHTEEFCNFSESNLTSLEGSPKYVGKHFSIYRNEIEDFAGAPEHIGGAVDFSNNKLRSLHNIHKHFKYIHEHIDLDWNPITSHVLGLLLIDGLEKVFMENTDVQKIINKHLASGQDVFACQEELIEAGFDEYAQL